MRLRIGLWLALLLLGVSPCLAGNAALTKAWQARQQELSRKIAQHLFDKQPIPQNGSVRYTARVKPDAAAPGGLVLSVDSLSVAPTGTSPGPAVRVEGDAAKQAMDTAFGPRDPAMSVHLGNLDIPVGTEITGTLTIKDGKPIVPPPPGGPAADPLVSPHQQAPAEPAEEPSILQRLLQFFGW
ncbi:hypothetical protein [Desulfovibrio sp. TomC]|uniref:hypothetical protein n=1 Tax=Desulfovibrio sp. TomC TaxID=1562888 RepID=UPI000574C7B0|nr:hypothetical protein [Desulfovibrio sp. TomC]KHK02815.1 hypothetical protein NY78_1765 [Desulfovibrio sp. TomC]